MANDQQQQQAEEGELSPGPSATATAATATARAATTAATESPQSRQKRENNLAAVLMGISVLFVFCQSAKIIPDVHEVIYCRLLPDRSGGSTCVIPDFIERVVSLSHLLLAINSSANFIIYTWRGEC